MVTGGDREDTPSHIRISVKVPAGGKSSVMVVDERPQGAHYALDTMDQRELVELSGLLEGVDGRLASALDDISALRARAAEAERTGQAANQELAAIAADQTRVRSNLSSVPPESELARRYMSLLPEQAIGSA